MQTDDYYKLSHKQICSEQLYEYKYKLFFIRKAFRLSRFLEKVIEHFGLLELEAASLRKWIAIYRRNMSPSSLRV